MPVSAATSVSPLFFRLLSLVLLLLQLPLTVAASPVVDVTVCFSVLTPYYQAMFVPQYYSYPNLRPHFKVIGTVEFPEATPRGVTSAYVRDGGDCDVYFGPGASTLAVAINAVMNSLWIAYIVTATEFSDRVTYPLLNRVIPTVNLNQQAILSLMNLFDWTTVTVLCTDNAYGQAATAALGKSVTVASQCIPQNGGYSDAATVVTSAMASKSRVLYIASNPYEAAHVFGVEALKAIDTEHRLIVIFAEVICSEDDTLWMSVEGALCAVFSTVDEVYEPFYSSFLMRDRTAEEAIVRDIAGFDYNNVTADAHCGYNAIAADGSRLVFRALDRYAAQFGALPPTPLDAAKWLRAQPPMYDGFTGAKSIPRGDNVFASPMRIYNSISNNDTMLVASVTADGNLTLLSDSFYVLGHSRSVNAMPPAVDLPPPEAPKTAYWAIAIAACVLIPLLIAAIIAWRQYQRSARRPLNSSAPFVVMFVGVKNAEDFVDEGDADAASAAFGHIAQTVQSAVRATGCYEARRVDDTTVMIVAKGVDCVLGCAAQIMVSTLEATDWRAIMQLAGSKYAKTQRVPTSPLNRRRSLPSLPDTARTTSTLEVSQSTLGTPRSARFVPPQLHIGIHFGYGLIDHDEASNTVSYSGAVVSRAAEVADFAVAGQILVSREAFEALAESKNGGEWQTFGEFASFPPAFAAAVPDALTFVPHGLSAESHECIREEVNRTAHSARGQRSCINGGAIAAALQHAEAGLSRRRIGVLVLDVGSLQRAADAEDVDATTISALLTDIASIAAEFRGEVQSVTGRTIIITVNAGLAAVQPAVRAALIAQEVTRYVDAQGHGIATAGVACGVALVGHYSNALSDGPTSAFATLGSLVSHATTAQHTAKSAGLRVCAFDSDCYDDLNARLHIVTISAVEVEASSTATAHRLVAIVAERNQSNDEWLYAIGEANDGVATNERAWQRYVQQHEAPSPATLLVIESELEVVNLGGRLHAPLMVSLANLSRFM